MHTTNYSAANAVTALGATHGYRLDGDFVYLNADISFAENDLLEVCCWSLQLLASPTAFSEGMLNGVKVAEFVLQPASGNIAVSAAVPLLPPASDLPQVMALALVGQGADGVSELSDCSVYPAPQIFFQPVMQGELGCRVADGEAEISIERIANLRSPENLSGTLALELRALDAPCLGNHWAGQPVASLVLGQLAGGAQWEGCHYRVPAVAVSPATKLTLMLREWTQAGYVTRDFREIPGNGIAEAAQEVVGETAPEAAAAEPAAVAPMVRKKGGKKGKVIAVKAKPGLVSVNTASAAELAAVKGVSKALAEAIVLARPFSSLNDLLRTKGMGAKLLEKLGKLLTL